MKIEHYEKWEPVASVHTPAARASIREDHNGLLVTLSFSEVVGGSDSDLEMKFGRVPAYAIYEEFVHPWNSYEAKSPPKLDERWQNYCFPLLIVIDSVWLESFSENQLINYPECIHYRLVTLDQIVDVLCNKAPGVSWVRTSEVSS
jgi:hypothetical protein